MAGQRRWAAVAVVAALLACATLARAHLPTDSQQRLDGRRRSLLVGGKARKAASAAPSVKVQNDCPYPVTFKASFTSEPGLPCPNKAFISKDVDFSRCLTNWSTIAAGASLAAPLPDFFDFSAYVADDDAASPTFYLSRQNEFPEAYLGGADDNAAECTTEAAEECVWWALGMAEKGKYVLTCPAYDPLAPVVEEETTPIEVVNDCPYPINLKVAYDLAEADSAAIGCAIDLWRSANEHLCVTNWQRLEAGESRYLAATADYNWAWAAHLVDAPAYNLSQLALAAFQGANNTLACPEEENIPCEWWAPNCFFCDPPTNGTQPLVLTCDKYNPSVPLPTED